MKFNNGNTLTVTSLGFIGFALYSAFVANDAAATYAALILASLEMADEV